MPTVSNSAQHPDASATRRGLVNLSAQVFAGLKTFNDGIAVAAGQKVDLTGASLEYSAGALRMRMAGVEKAYVDAVGNFVFGGTAGGTITGGTTSANLLLDGTTGSRLKYANTDVTMDGATLTLNANSNTLKLTSGGLVTFTNRVDVSVASGSDFLKALDGGRLNFSTADASAYLYRRAADTIHAQGNFESTRLEVNETTPYADNSVALSVNSTTKTWLFNMYDTGAPRLWLSRTGNFGIGAIATPLWTVSGTTGTVSSAVASGSDSLRLLNGARLNFSTADASAYLYRSAADTISTPGTLGAVYFAQGAGGITSGGGSIKLVSGVSDGAAAIGGYYNNTVALADSTAKLFIWFNNSVERLSIGPTGSIASAGTNTNDFAGPVRVTYAGTQFVANSSSAGFSAATASGSVAYSMLDGARLNLSTADANTYLTRYEVNVVGVAGSMRIGVNTSGGSIYGGAAQLILNDSVGAYLTYGNSSTTVDGIQVKLAGGAADSSTAVAVILRSTFTFAAAGAKLLSVRNLAVEKVAFGALGDVLQSGTDSTGTPGAATVNKPIGVASMAGAATTCVVTNSLATTTSHIVITWHGDLGAQTKQPWVTRAAGSFTVNVGTAPAGAVAFSWEVKTLI